MASEKYDAVLPRIEESGSMAARRSRFPCCVHVPEGSFRVSEIWDSQEQFEAFGERLMPVLTEGGVELAGPPEILEIHNLLTR